MENEVLLTPVSQITKHNQFLSHIYEEDKEIELHKNETKSEKLLENFIDTKSDKAFRSVENEFGGNINEFHHNQTVSTVIRNDININKYKEIQTEQVVPVPIPENNELQQCT
ncbi:hypothetical protein CEXT_542251 [Caerostris extrusa]|uniref:Uncharacterized protein n=1 Tax=Caerostris extrusa TaxID=172846 RepID=A0AAV4T0E4_CAEEX|nr:hypothetical protein CEXT_542251 [Caerostris extrusa]